MPATGWTTRAAITPNIVGKYGAPVQALLKKAAALDIAFLCPLHGPVWRRDIAWFVEKYQRWSTYRPEEDGVLVAYASIYGHTENAAEVFAMALRDAGVKHVAMYDVSVTHPSYILSDAFRFGKLGAAFGHLQPRRIPGHGNAASGPQGARPCRIAPWRWWRTAPGLRRQANRCARSWAP